MGIVYSNLNYDQYGNPTIYNGGTATTDSAGNDISRPEFKPYADSNFQITPEYEQYLNSTPSAGSKPTGNYGQLMGGVYGVSMQRPDGSYWFQVTDKNGVPQISGPPQYSDSEIESGIRIGPDERTNDQIRTDTQNTQQQQSTVYNSYRNRPPTSTGGTGTGTGTGTGGDIVVGPTPPGGTGGGTTNPPPVVGPTPPGGNTGGGTTTPPTPEPPLPPYQPPGGNGGMTDPAWNGVMAGQVGWPSVSNLPADQLKSVDEQAYFARYPDVLAAYRQDPKGMSADAFAMWHWENYGKAEGRDMPYSTNMPENPTTVGPGTWFQNGPDGQKFKVINVNADGSITWERDDGALFQNIDAATFEQYFPGQSGRFYTRELTVDPAKETVAGQLSALLNADSSYLQRAKGRAMDFANSRGLMNSSLAATAGEAAAIDAAMPIAQADAGIYGNAKQYNVNLANTRAGEALAFTRQKELISIDQTFQRALQDDAQAWQTMENVDQRTWQAAQTEAQRAWQTIQNQMDRDLSLQLNSATQTATGKQAVTTLIFQHEQAIAAILADPEISNNPADGQNGVSPKQQLINKANELFKQNLTAVAKIYGVDVSDLYPGSSTGNDSGTPSTSTGPDGTKTNGTVRMVGDQMQDAQGNWWVWNGVTWVPKIVVGPGDGGGDGSEGGGSSGGEANGPGDGPSGGESW